MNTNIYIYIMCTNALAVPFWHNNPVPFCRRTATWPRSCWRSIWRTGEWWFSWRSVWRSTRASGKVGCNSRRPPRPWSARWPDSRESTGTIGTGTPAESPVGRPRSQRPMPGWPGRWWAGRPAPRSPRKCSLKRIRRVQKYYVILMYVVLVTVSFGEEIRLGYLEVLLI